MSRRPVLVGIGRTEYSRNSGRTTLAMAAEATRGALEDAGMDYRDVDGFSTFAANDSVFGAAVAHAIGIDQLHWNIDLFGGGNYATSVVSNAAMAIEAGACEAALAFRSLNGRSGHRFGRADGALSVGGDRQFTGPHGYLTPPQWLALWAQKHQDVYGSTCEDLGQIAITQRTHAGPNPHAVQRKQIDMQDYLAGRWINEPFRIYDCALEADGAVAVLVTTEERARDLRHKPIGILGHVEAMGHGGSFDHWPDYTTMYSSEAAPLLWERSGIGPDDVDLACMYDCFTYTVMVTMEDYGFCEKGQAGAYFSEGRATYGGEVVVNPHGGLISEGYIHGLNHTFEAVLQLRHQASDRQVEGAELALVTAGAGPVGGAMVLARAN